MMNDQLKQAYENDILLAFEAKLYLGNKAIHRACVDIIKEQMETLFKVNCTEAERHEAVAVMRHLKMIYDRITRAADAGDNAVAELARATKEEGLQ